MPNDEKEEARVRIINASIQLFSQKGYDATRVNEIAEAAGVNKALIYYYFKSKEEILDHLLHSFYEDVKNFSMAFIKSYFIDMIKAKQLDIEADRLHFTSKDDIEIFLRGIRSYYGNIIDYIVKNRRIIRIIFLESLKESKHRSDLFSVYSFLTENETNPFYKIINDADPDFNIPGHMIEFKFFYSLIPMMSFAAYYDDWKKIRGLTDEQLRESFTRALDNYVSLFVLGQDIIINR
jgi:AcrR family transcriptional regulator